MRKVRREPRSLLNPPTRLFRRITSLSLGNTTGFPHPVPLDLFDPFGFSKGASAEKKARGLKAEINNGRAAMLGIFGFLCAAKIPGSVPLLSFIPAYAGNPMAPFEGNFHLGA